MKLLYEKKNRGHVKTTIWVLGGEEINNQARQIVRIFAIPVLGEIFVFGLLNLSMRAL